VIVSLPIEVINAGENDDVKMLDVLLPIEAEVLVVIGIEVVFMTVEAMVLMFCDVDGELVVGDIVVLII